jgi:signal transduction histidine kinase
VFARAGRALAVGGDGPALAFATSGVVDQALDVLLDNALRHGGGATNIEVVAADERVAVRVRDEGPGVADRLVGRIFERDVSGRADSGLGIGLPLARALVEADGGTLRLVSPRPATFEFSLPEPPTVRTVSDGHTEDLRPRRPR